MITITNECVGEWVSVIDNMNKWVSEWIWIWMLKKKVAYVIKNDWIVHFSICRNLWILDLEVLFTYEYTYI